MLDSSLNSTLKMRGSIVVKEAKRPKKKRDNKSGDGAGQKRKEITNLGTEQEQEC